MGEDVGRYGVASRVSRGLLEEFGPGAHARHAALGVRFVGAGIGAAIGGMRPIVEVMTINFSLLALDQIVNNAATLRHMSGGQFSVPLVVRMATGGGPPDGRAALAQPRGLVRARSGHQGRSRPATRRRRARHAARGAADPDPVFIFEHAMLYPARGRGREDGRAGRHRARGDPAAGRDVTLSPTAARLVRPCAAAETLAARGRSTPR